MNKSEAAEYLGVSVRAVERYASSGKLASHYERGKTGKVLAFDPEEVTRFRAELETPQEREATTSDAPRQASNRQAMTGAASTALARRVEPSGGASIELVRALQELANLTNDSARQVAPIVPTEAKLLLSLSEAQALTGLSRGVLRDAIDAGKLKAQIIGRGFKVKRNDLDKYIDKL
jgi:excisionase family DNA binding protein